MADVAAQVVAWHNRHPLARRITQRDVQGIGIVAAPFARPAQPHWNTVTPKRGLLALMFPKRVDRRPWAVFSEDALPDISVPKLAHFALQRGWIERPGPAELPERALQVDRDLLDSRGGAASDPPERLDRFLVTAAIDLGAAPPRLILGRGRRMPVLGRRLWSLPRIAMLGGALLATLVMGVAALWLAATGRATDAARSGTPAASAASTAVAAGPAAPASRSPPPAGPAASVATPVRAASVAPLAPPAAAAASATAPSGTRAATASASPGAAPASAASPSPVAPPVPATAPAAAPAAPIAPSLPAARAPAAAVPASSASLPAVAPPLSVTQRASAPLVPSLRPDLAASARAEAARHPGLPERPPAASGPAMAAPGMQRAPGPADNASAARAPARFYALVSRPLRTQAEADALLQRLRAETQRIAHPTAIETGLQRTPEGWRVTWWPFTHPRQAENARAALAARRVELEMVEF